MITVTSSVLPICGWLSLFTVIKSVFYNWETPPTKTRQQWSALSNLAPTCWLNANIWCDRSRVTTGKNVPAYDGAHSLEACVASHC